MVWLWTILAVGSMVLPTSAKLSGLEKAKFRDKQSEVLAKHASAYYNKLAEEGMRMEPLAVVFVNDGLQRCIPISIHPDPGPPSIVCSEGNNIEECAKITEMSKIAWSVTMEEVKAEAMAYESISILGNSEVSGNSVVPDVNAAMETIHLHSPFDEERRRKVRAAKGSHERFARGFFLGLLIFALIAAVAYTVVNSTINSSAINRNLEATKKALNETFLMDQVQNKLFKDIERRLNVTEVLIGAQGEFVTKGLPIITSRASRIRLAVKEAAETGFIGKDLVSTPQLLNVLQVSPDMDSRHLESIKANPSILRELGKFHMTRVSVQNGSFELQGDFCLSLPEMSETYLLGHPVHQGIFSSDRSQFARPRLTSSFLVSMEDIEKGNIANHRYVNLGECEQERSGYIPCPAHAISRASLDGGCTVPPTEACDWEVQKTTADFVSYEMVNGQPWVATRNHFYDLVDFKGKRTKNPVERSIAFYQIGVSESLEFGSTKITGRTSFFSPPQALVKLNLEPLPNSELRQDTQILQIELEAREDNTKRAVIAQNNLPSTKNIFAQAVDWVSGLWQSLLDKLGFYLYVATAIIIILFLIPCVCCCCQAFVSKCLKYACGKLCCRKSKSSQSHSHGQAVANTAKDYHLSFSEV